MTPAPPAPPAPAPDPPVLFVKICGITSEADALLCVSLGADAVGFIFAPSIRQVSVQQAGDIAKRLPPEILTVGVFRDEAPQRVVEKVRQAGLGAAQLHGHESSQETAWVRARIPTVIKAFPAGDRTIRRFAEFGADYLLIDGDNPGSGEVFDWRLAEGVANPSRLGGPAPGKGGAGRGPPAPVRGRRGLGGRGRSGAQGSAQGAGLHCAGPQRRGGGRGP
jgi:phosphoribosylanthranilate isomerase